MQAVSTLQARGAPRKPIDLDVVEYWNYEANKGINPQDLGRTDAKQRVWWLNCCKHIKKTTVKNVCQFGADKVLHCDQCFPPPILSLVYTRNMRKK